MTDKVLGRGALGIFLLRYGHHFPYTSLLIQSLKATHYISLERNIDDLKVCPRNFSSVLLCHRVSLRKFGPTYQRESGEN